ncbi:MAG: tRNA uridine-5-carboxymethylaminomethyl(34) synthesis GTPase MnmE [Ruminococcus sp.]|jgi:tRNA modification GTPase|nr:tRNA uridine-5-carboxymethylaminomethyl(34) synthesis GTPase MnmE [Ruminococcus sp.]
MQTLDTIAAISTPIGYGGIAVIRISGDNALAAADTLFSGISRIDPPSSWAGYSCAYGKILYKDAVLDECILTVYKAPRSYTGEDVVEISCHGGVFSAGEILRAVYSLGVRPAHAGEFTERAFLNGKTTLTQAEAVMDIISAKGKAELRSALKVRDGAVYKRIKIVSEKLVGLLAALAVWADYPDDEDIDLLAGESFNNIQNVISNAEQNLSALTEGFAFGQLIKAGIPLVIAGKPNVGKSSIMNVLSGTSRSIVTDIPGTTRDIIENEIRIGDYTFRIFDTAGIHETKDVIEQTGTDLAKEKIAEAEIILAVFDSSMPLDEADEEIIRLTAGDRAIAVLNKSDIAGAADFSGILSKYKKTVSLSAKTGAGFEKLTEFLTELPEIKAVAGAEIILNDRQNAAAAAALGFLREAKTAAAGEIPLDALTILINAALEKLLELTGESAEAAVTRSVFDNFCVGK